MTVSFLDLMAETRTIIICGKFALLSRWKVLRVGSRGRLPMGVAVVERFQQGWFASALDGIASMCLVGALSAA